MKTTKISDFVPVSVAMLALGVLIGVFLPQPQPDPRVIEVEKQYVEHLRIPLDATLRCEVRHFRFTHEEINGTTVLYEPSDQDCTVEKEGK